MGLEFWGELRICFYALIHSVANDIPTELLQTSKVSGTERNTLIVMLINTGAAK